MRGIGGVCKKEKEAKTPSAVSSPEGKRPRSYPDSECKKLLPRSSHQSDVVDGLIPWHSSIPPTMLAHTNYMLTQFTYLVKLVVKFPGNFILRFIGQPAIICFTVGKRPYKVRRKSYGFFSIDILRYTISFSCLSPSKIG